MQKAILVSLELQGLICFLNILKKCHMQQDPPKNKSLFLLEFHGHQVPIMHKYADTLFFKGQPLRYTTC
jgi:hypothetical protein